MSTYNDKLVAHWKDGANLVGLGLALSPWALSSPTSRF
jgi:hypothetical protein